MVSSFSQTTKKYLPDMLIEKRNVHCFGNAFVRCVRVFEILGGVGDYFALLEVWVTTSLRATPRIKLLTKLPTNIVSGTQSANDFVHSLKLSPRLANR